MFIKKILYSNDEYEDKMFVDIIISDGEYECISLYDLPELKEGDKLKSPLDALCPINVMKTNKTIGMYPVENLHYAYFVVGIVTHIKPDIISIGNIHIDIDNSLPNDIKMGEKIEFKCDRLDL